MNPLIKQMRDKYECTPGRIRCPQGGRDVLKLCDEIEWLEGVIRDIQRGAPEAVQNEIERKLNAR